MSVTITREQILETAVRQSAIDLHCAPEDFLRGENRVVCSEPSPDARRYLELPFLLNLVSYGNNAVSYTHLVIPHIIFPAKVPFDTAVFLNFVRYFHLALFFDSYLLRTFMICLHYFWRISSGCRALCFSHYAPLALYRQYYMLLF